VKHGSITKLKVGLSAAALAVALAACGGAAGSGSPTAVPAGAAPTAAPLPTIVIPTAAPSLDLGVSGSGEIIAAQDADLVFIVQGIVAEVKVKEGDAVKKGDLLAILDTRALDQQLQQAEAQVAAARAGEAALTEAPRELDLAAAQAGVTQAQAALDAVRAGPKKQDIATAEAALTAAQVNVQATRDRLSLGKTQAELQMQQAAQALTQAQARYAQAKYNWEYAKDSGNDPIVPEVTNSAGKRVENKLSDGQLENYYAQFVQAEAALRQSEKALELSKLAFDSARQSELTGIAAVEQQARQAELALEKLKLPADRDRVAAAQAGLAQARAAEGRLIPDPRESAKAQAKATIAQAEASLELAQINRERAELRAPFDGIVSAVNIDPGDSAATGALPAIQVVDISQMHVDVQLSDVDIGRVQVGQAAEVRVDSAPGKIYIGRIEYIAPTATAIGNIRTFLVRVELDDLTGLRAGMTARVNITQ
jgi:HlyD family secretion protein